MSENTPTQVIVQSQTEDQIAALTRDYDRREAQQDQQSVLKVVAHEREEDLRYARKSLQSKIHRLREEHKKLDEEITEAGKELAENVDSYLSLYELDRAINALNEIPGLVASGTTNYYYRDDEDEEPVQFIREAETVQRDDEKRLFTVVVYAGQVDKKGNIRNTFGKIKSVVAYNPEESDKVKAMAELSSRIEEASGKLEECDRLIGEMPRWRQAREAQLARYQLQDSERGQKYLSQLESSINNDVTALLESE